MKVKGCLSNIIKVGILSLAVVGFVSIGGWDFIKDKIPEIPFFKKNQETLLEKANKIADFSKINQEEYEISRTANVFGYKAVVAEHIASEQRFIILEPQKEALLTKSDFENGEIDGKIQKLSKDLGKHFVRLKDIKITKKSKMYGMKQNIPYAKIEATPVNMPPIKQLTGIVGVAEKNDKEYLVIAINSDGKYSQIITEQFFKDIK